MEPTWKYRIVTRRTCRCLRSASIPKEPRGPRLLSTDDVRFVSQVSTRSKDCRVPIFVPTIPRFLDTDTSRWWHDIENMPRAQQYWGGKSLHITYLIRYLFLDQEKLLELSERNRSELRRMCETFVRKPVFGQGPTEEQATEEEG